MNNPFQPNFQNLQGAAPATDFDNMSDADLQKLINAAHQVKTGKPGQLRSAPPPPAKKVVDLDALLGGGNG